MTRNEWSALFQVFLEMHGALEKFIGACHSRGLYDDGQHTIRCHPRSWVNHSFEWAQTPQGHAYWCDLDNKWEEAINKCYA